MTLLSGQKFWLKRFSLFKKKKAKRRRKKVLCGFHRAETEFVFHIFCFSDPVAERPGEAEVPEVGFVSQPLSSHCTRGNHSAIMIVFVNCSKSKENPHSILHWQQGWRCISSAVSVAFRQFLWQWNRY